MEAQKIIKQLALPLSTKKHATLKKKMNYSLDYTYLKADDLTNNVKLSRRPENKLVGKLNYNIDMNNKILYTDSKNK